MIVKQGICRHPDPSYEIALIPSCLCYIIPHLLAVAKRYVNVVIQMQRDQAESDHPDLHKKKKKSHWHIHLL